MLQLNVTYSVQLIVAGIPLLEQMAETDVIFSKLMELSVNVTQITAQEMHLQVVVNKCVKAQ